MKYTTIIVLVALVSVLALFGAGASTGYMYASSGHEKERAEAARAYAELEAKAERISSEAGKEHVRVETKIRTVFRDRVVYRDKEVPVEVRIREDAACVVPDRFIRMWNSANRGELPDASSGASADSD